MLNIGQKLYGYCGGYFGRDSYEDKRVEAMGADWIIVREIESGEVFSACREGIFQLLEPYTKEEGK